MKITENSSVFAPVGCDCDQDVSKAVIEHLDVVDDHAVEHAAGLLGIAQVGRQAATVASPIATVPAGPPR
jgi:hypothetical protein